MDINEIDIANIFLVGTRGNGNIVIMRPPNRPITPQEAIALAGWLFVLSEAKKEDLEKVIQKIQNC